MRLAAIATIVFSLALPSLADLTDHLAISASVGAGNQAAYCVIDFGNTSHAFEYNYDGVKTGWNLLQALQSDADLAMQVNWYNFGTPEEPDLVPFPKAFGFDLDVQVDDDGSFGKYWAYYISKDGVNWIESNEGVYGRDLGVLRDWEGTVLEAEGWIWEGWSWTPTGYPNQVAPRTPIAGDANNDFQVTDADYTIWADSYNQADATWQMGDFNHDHLITDADYTIWADHYGFSQNTIVPEPMTCATLALAGLGLLRRRR